MAAKKYMLTGTGYEEVWIDLLRLTNHHLAVEWLIWSSISELLMQSDMERAGKLDCYGMILQAVNMDGSRLWDYIYHALGKPAPDPMMQMMKDQYELSDEINQLGTWWKQMIADRREDICRDLICWIADFERKILLPVEEIIAECEQEWMGMIGITADSPGNREKKYRAYRKHFRELSRKLDTVIETLNLIR